MNSKGLGAAIAGCALWLAGTAPADAFLFWGSERQPVRPPVAFPDVSEPPRRKPVAKKPVVRPLTPAEKAADGAALARAKRGQLTVAVSLDRQELTFYSDDTEIGRSRISSGTASHPTPTGIFSIIQKSRHHKSNLYSDAPMPYMQRLTWSGVALHQGKLPGYPASHGCIRMPEAFARQLWSASRMGMRVIVTHEPVTLTTFTHPALFKQKAKEVASAPTLVRVAEAGITANDATRLPTRPAIDANAPAAPLAQTSPGSDIIVDGVPTIEPASATFDSAPSEPATESQPTIAAPAPAIVPPSAVVAAAPQTDAQGRPLRSGPVSVFISRRESKVYVRKQFAPVFEAPITIENPEQPFGTHLFTAIAANDDDSMKWTSVTLPGRPPIAGQQAAKRANAPRTDVDAMASDPARSLERVTLPADAVARITEMMSVGASVIITDYGLGPETGLETDFIVMARKFY